MKQQLCTIITLIFSIFSSSIFAQNHTISGFASEQTSKETLLGVSIYLPEHQLYAHTNGYGFYSLSYPACDSLTVIYFCMGYNTDSLRIASQEDLKLNIELKRGYQLESVTVTSERKSVETAQMSTVNISAKEIQSLPALFGEQDLFKTLTLLPGVMTSTEGTSGIHVRGGSPDQNLIILDEATIYNASHLLGFFSIFNGNAIKSADLIKGGFPARYGGRLSSIIDIKMKEGNKQQYHGEGGLGILSGNFAVEGPIVKNKSSFMISGRRTWFDILARPILAIMNDGINGGYYFYDLNAKFNYDFGDKDKLFISGYFGRDRFGMKETYKEDGIKEYEYSSGLFWQNGIATARWNHIFNSKWFSNLSFIFSDYTLSIDMKEEQFVDDPYFFKLKFNSGIRDYSLKYDLTYLPNNWNTIEMGTFATYHECRPNAAQISSDVETIENSYKEMGIEYGFYIEDQIKIKNKIRINPGLRVNLFSLPEKTYFLPEPRLSISYNPRKDLAIKASYAMMHQYMLLLSPMTIGLPTDLWVPVTDKIKPQRSQQVALGVVYEPKKLNLHFSIEGYYKRMDNIIAFKPGSSFMLESLEGIFDPTMDNQRDVWERNITTGRGWAYGAEFLVRKSVGKFTGWAGYTLSWIEHQFDDLNKGKKFFAKNDRRHNISIVLMYRLNKVVNFSLAWTYASGNYLTLPDQIYTRERFEDSSLPGSNNYYNNYVESFSSKNNFKAQAFHHLDIGVQFTKHYKNSRYKSIVDISVYNVYNHKNPFYYLMGFSYGNDEYFLEKVTIFPIIPSLTYRFLF